jgi:tetratricopeptide (TPR) repeat protein
MMTSLRSALRVLALSVVLAVLSGSVASAKVEPYPFSTWFEQDPVPMAIGETLDSKLQTLNPLDYAGARIGLDVRNVELPRGWEGAYRYCCRFPIIDYVSNRPLYMKQWAEDNSAQVVAEQRRVGIGLMHYALEVLQGAKGHWRGFEGESLGGTARKQLDAAGFTPRYQQALLKLVTEFIRAGRWARRGTEGLSAADKVFFAANPGYYLAPDGKRMAELTGNTDGQLDFVARARRVHHEWIFTAADILADAVSEYVTSTAGFGVADCYLDTAKARRTLDLVTPAGTVEVSGFGNDTHSKDVALLIDLGGDDTYTNNAGGCGRNGGVAVCIDHSGNDRYLAPDSSYVQGFGFLGVGMLVDLVGNDVYKAKHFSQGAGIMGVGVLWDKAGNDTFRANAFCQGAGMFGLGMMLDDSGDDVYDCATNGQGSATTLGLGILSDLEGNDQYRLACDTTLDAMGGLAGYGQGGALSFRAYPWEKKLVAYGGVGMLVDDKGNDTYTSKGWNCQGGSYIMSLGVLVDNEGNDHYDCGTGQGSGIHVTNAILIDKKGDDVYEGGFRAGGSGGDRSPGFLLDYEGNDVYKSATSSYGTACKPFAYSLFIDYKGDDKYICEKPKGPVLFNDWHSFGGVWPESDPNAWPYAISLDLGGNDDYQVRNRANNSETHSFGHGIHLDMEWKGGDVIGKVERPLDEYLNVHGDYVGPAVVHALDPEFRSGTFSHFEAIGKAVVFGRGAISPVCDWLVSETNRQMNRDLLECLHCLFVQGGLKWKHVADVRKLLRAADPEVRTVIADDLGLWKMSGAEDALIEAAKTDSNAQVRRFALRSLLRFESVKTLPLARKLATEDTSEDVRRMAVALTGKVRPGSDVRPLLETVLANDKASSVRCAAADALGNLGDPQAAEPLRKAAKTIDVYLQRACGRALCALYQVDGIDLLIKTMSFPSIDAFYNYDRNVPNYVSAFAGINLPDSERYVQAKWQAWYDAHRDSINIKANADAFKAWTVLTDSLRGEADSVQVSRYEAFLKRFPDHGRARAELAGKLNGLAWSMVTAAKGTPGYNPKLGLKYALRAVGLLPDANAYDTAIEAYLANGMKSDALRICREALAKFPDEKMLQDRLAQLERK